MTKSLSRQFPARKRIALVAHDPDVKALLRIGVVWNIPMACDQATADYMLTSPLMQAEYEAVLPDYSEYVGRRAG